MNTLFHITSANRRMLLLLIGSHLVWTCGLISLWSFGRLIDVFFFEWSIVFLLLQLVSAAHLIPPALWMSSEPRSRLFYLFWGIFLALAVWLINQPNTLGYWQPILSALKSSLLLLVATLIGTVLARHVNKLWEILPICLVMTFADFVSWFAGPTANFVEQIDTYYRAPSGQAPMIDMVLIKFASPGFATLTPIFGISDWIMVVFFAAVAHRFSINDNLFSLFGLIKQANIPSQNTARVSTYLPLSAAALFAAIALAQSTGMFIPALPFVGLIVLLWYALRYLITYNK